MADCAPEKVPLRTVRFGALVTTGLPTEPAGQGANQHPCPRLSWRCTSSGQSASALDTPLRMRNATVRSQVRTARPDKLQDVHRGHQPPAGSTIVCAGVGGVPGFVPPGFRAVPRVTERFFMNLRSIVGGMWAPTRTVTEIPGPGRLRASFPLCQGGSRCETAAPHAVPEAPDGTDVPSLMVP